MQRHTLLQVSTIARVAALALLWLSMSPGSVWAQLDNAFRVTVEAKTSAHPDADVGWNEAYELDGQQGKAIAVVRGETYTFELDGVPPIHPFYVTTSAVGQGAEPYEEGVEGNFATGDEVVTLTVDENTPDLLYYQCGSHEYMGWRIYVVDEATAGLEMVTQGLTSPITMAQPDDDTDRLFVVDQAGQIHVILSDGTQLEEPFLDVADRLVTLNEDFDERGLLGLAFHPDYSENGRFFVYYSAPLREGAPDGWNHTATISEFNVSELEPNAADAESEQILLEVDEPQGNHNGGTLLFGPDGHLYVSLGDGGGANDTPMGHVPDWYDANDGGNGQDVEENLLGSILRIDVDSGDPYGIPPDNPFAEGDGGDEIYAYGFRNPYRMSFDMGGEFGLLVGDAGQNRWEEVSRAELGGNYGWNVKEGTHCFSTANPDEDASECPDEVGTGHPDEGAPLVDPVIEYQNANQEGGVGLVVVGGVVYRGAALSDFDGKYIFGDWSYSFSESEGLLFVATPVDDGRWPMQTLHLEGREEEELHEYLLGFGQDNDGEVYVLTTEMSGPTGNTGKVYRLVAPTDVASESESEIPERITLHQNFPNPFNPSTTIRFDIAAAADVSVVVFDVLGREIATLVDRRIAAGSHSVTWDGLSDAGRAVPSGTYVVRVQSGDERSSRTMTLIK